MTTTTDRRTTEVAGRVPTMSEADALREAIAAASETGASPWFLIGTIEAAAATVSPLSRESATQVLRSFVAVP